jgi:thioredoxin reductase
MKYTDIAIISGGLAESTAAAMLGRAGIATVLIDPHQTLSIRLPRRKISGDEQLDRFYQTGIADSVLRSATHDAENWIARFGYLLDKKPSS